MEQSLTCLILQSHMIQVYGDINEPLFTVDDIMIGLLGYKRATDQRWFRGILSDKQFVATCHGVDYLTEDGLYETLFASKQQIAKEFRQLVRQMLKEKRQSTIQQLEESKLQISAQQIQIEELKKQQSGCIYNIQVDGIIKYIGQTTNFEKRQTQHRKKINDIIEEYDKKSELHYIHLAVDHLNSKNIAFEVQKSNIQQKNLAGEEILAKQQFQNLYCKIPPAKLQKTLPQYITKTNNDYYCDLCKVNLKQYARHCVSKIHNIIPGDLVCAQDM